MEKLLEELAYYLEQQEVGTRTTDLFIGDFVGDTDNQVYIKHTGGVEPYKDIPVARPTIQITIRNKDYQTGFTKAYVIFDLLDRKDDRLILKAGGEIDVMQINALAEPQHLGQDTSSRHVFTINFVVMCRRK